VHKLLLRLLSASVFLFSSISYAQTSLWQISHDDKVLYLGGTIHMLRSSDYPLPVEYDAVYKQADRLVFETDIAGLGDPTVRQKMQQAVMYPAGNTLRQKLSPDVYQQVAERWQQSGFPLPVLDTLKPAGVVMTLTLAQLRSNGVDAEGLDQHYYQRADNDRKPVEGLETVNQQISFLAAMGEGNEDEFLLQTLEELELSEEYMQKLIKSWRSGDRAALEKLIVTDMRVEFPGIYQSLLVQRNNAWLPQIKRMLSNRSVELVLVGAGHLVGPDGLLQQLQKAGYIVRQVRKQDLPSVPY